jgi:hypothetical protein
MLYGVQRLDDGTIINYKLTRNGFYAAAGKNKSDKRRRKWMQVEDIQAMNQLLCANHSKTVNLQQWSRYIEILKDNHALIWAHKFHKKWALMDFRFYTMKHKVMDHFLLKVVKEAKLKSGKEYVRIAYGNGYFLSSGKGEKIAAPNFLMYKRAKRIFGNRMNVVDEGFTSKCCSNCGANNKISILQDIYDEKKKVKGKKWFAVRGLKHCEVCSNFYDRDHNAALNIAMVHAAAALIPPSRPRHLKYNNETVVEPTNFILYV